MKTYSLVTTNQPLEVAVRSGNQLWLVPAAKWTDAHSRTVLIVLPLGDGVCYHIALGKWSGMLVRIEYTTVLAADVPAELINKVLREDNTALVRTNCPMCRLGEDMILLPCVDNIPVAEPVGLLFVTLFDPLRPQFHLIQTGAYKGCVIRNDRIETLLS